MSNFNSHVFEDLEFRVKLKGLVDKILENFRSPSTPDDYELMKNNNIQEFSDNLKAVSTMLGVYARYVQHCINKIDVDYAGCEIIDRMAVTEILDGIKESLEESIEERLDPCLNMYLNRFKERLENCWNMYLSDTIPYSDYNKPLARLRINGLMDWVRSYNEDFLPLFVDSIDREIQDTDTPPGSIRPKYKAFLEDAKRMIIAFLNRGFSYREFSFGISVDRARDMNATIDDVLNRGENMNTTEEGVKTIAENTKYLLEMYREAVKELDKELFIGTRDARTCVLEAVLYIARHLILRNYDSAKSLIYKIKSIPEFRRDPTIDIAMDILSEWMVWFDSTELYNGPRETVKDSIKNAIKSFLTKEPKADTAVKGVTFLHQHNAKRIEGLKDNPNGREYSRKDICFGALVKVCDGMERFWVKVTDIGTLRIFGSIVDSLVGNNGYGRGDKIAFCLSEVWDVISPQPKADLILGVTKEDFVGIMMECYHELESSHLNKNIHSAIYLIANLVRVGMCVKQVINEIKRPKPIGFYGINHCVMRDSTIDEIAADIMTNICERNESTVRFYSAMALASFPTKKPHPFLKVLVIAPAIEVVREALAKAPKPEDTFKPGDRVCFVKQNIYKDNGPSVLNCYLSVVKGWSVERFGEEKMGDQTCDFSNAFHVLPMETLSLDVEDEDDVQDLIEHEDFGKSLITSCLSWISGNITLCPVDEEHFPKLNEIAAKITGVSNGR